LPTSFSHAAVRDAARAKETGKVLAACDHLRDTLLPPLGVVLEDSAAAAPATPSAGAGAAVAAAARPALWKLRDPAELRREAEDKARKVADKAREKAEAEAARLKREADKLAAASIRPEDMFRAPALPDAAAKYSAYDAEGLPTHDAAGVALGDKAVKKLRKDLEKQRKEHEWFLTKTTGASGGAVAGAGAAGAAE
jgi:cysteinyl-tRNA synthetase